ncbi:MAG: hypothetical protein KC588_17465 [Nitrospira sp.]|nr:hypothetical protein [Nitrospira sp.]
MRVDLLATLRQGQPVFSSVHPDGRAAGADQGEQMGLRKLDVEIQQMLGVWQAFTTWPLIKW